MHHIVPYYSNTKRSHELGKLVGLHSSYVVETHVAALLLFDDNQDVQIIIHEYMTFSKILEQIHISETGR